MLRSQILALIQGIGSVAPRPAGAGEGIGNELSNTLIGGRAANILDGRLGADTMIGGDGNEIYVVDNNGDVVIEQANEGIDTVESSVTYTLSANVENLTLTGSAPINGTGNALINDVRGNDAPNVLDGGAGDDSLQGSGGADTYLFGRGSGRDIVFDSGSASEIDTIQLDSAVAPADVEVYRRDYDLVLVIAGTTDEIALGSFFDSPGYDQKQVRFSDDTMWNETELRTRALDTGLIFGSAGDDTLTLSANARYRGLVGNAGNDLLTGGNWDDVLYGDVTFQSSFGNQIIGNDTLVGGAGNDTLIDFRGTNRFDGGAGDDTLQLGTGVDTVVFGRGAGVDVVTADNNRQDIDIIEIAPDIIAADVTMTWRSASTADLVISDSGDRLTLQLSTDWFAVGPETTQAIVRFGDGTEWSLAWSSLNVGVSGATAFDDVLDASFPADLAGLEGDDTYVLGSSGIPGAYAVVEAPGQGIDTVQSLFDYALDPEVEYLFLTETNSSVTPIALRGRGNELDNLIVGNTGDNILDGGDGNDVLVGGMFRLLEGPPYVAGTGSDILIGGAGDDILMEDGGDVGFAGDHVDNPPRQADDLLLGGTGNDTYIVHSQQQTIVELADEGTDTVKSTVSYTLGEDFENLELVSPPLRLDDEGNAVSPSPLNGTGNDLDNVIIGTGDNNVLSGMGGRDTLWGGNAVDRDSGLASSGDDTLIGGSGGDTYLYKIGDGIDTIQDVSMPGEGNRIQFGVGIARTDLGFSHDQAAGTLSIQVGTSGADKLLLTNFDPTNANGSLVVETLSFADGSTAQLAQLLGMTGAITGTAGNDVLTGTTGNDTIIGGAGNDTLSGGAGDDIYVFNPGDGIDTISDTSAPDEGNQLEFGVGVDPTSLKLDLGSLLIHVGTNGDALHLTTFDPANVLGPRTIESFRFADGTVLSYDELVARGFDLTATAGNDSITGTDVVDRIAGLAGDDQLNGGAGDDILSGGSGNDVIDGGSGADAMTGGSGDDTYVVDDLGDIVIENVNEGIDTVQSILSYTLGASVENLVLTGSASLAGAGNQLNNVMTGNSGDNALDGGAGADILVGGTGDDTYAVDNAGDQITENVTEGMDTVQSSISYTLGANVENLILTGTSPISGMGNALDNVLTGNSGDNVLDGAAGADTMIGGAGNDMYVLDQAGDVVTESLNDGLDTIQSAISYTLGANLESLILTGTGAINGTGNALDNVLMGNSAANVLNGGSGNDTFVVSIGDAVVEAPNQGLDTVVSDINWTLSSNLENLTLAGIAAITGTGNAGSNVLTGNSGDNVLDGAAGADTMIGGAGNDTYLVDNTGDVVTENGNEGSDTVQSTLTHTLGANVENLTLVGTAAINGTGNALDNLLLGNSAANVLTAGAGNDTLNGGAGNDTLIGGTGNDTYVVDAAGDVVTELSNEGTDTVLSSITYTLKANVENLMLSGSAAINGTGNALDNSLVGNSGANALTGGAGNDTYVVSTGDSVVETANNGTDTVLSDVSWTLGSNVENLTLTGSANINGTGSSAKNVLIGNSGNNTLDGGSGDDTAEGGAGNDILFGGSGNDGLNGGEGVDTLNGGSGDDLLRGGAGNDSITGGSGADQVTGGSGNDVLTGGSGNDVYMFARGDGQDTIIDSDPFAGNQDRTVFGSINPLDLVISRQANDLRLTIHGTADSLVIQNWYVSASNQVEDVQAGNGQHLVNSQVDQLIQAMASFSQQSGLTWDQAIDQRPQEVQTVLAASWH